MMTHEELCICMLQALDYHDTGCFLTRISTDYMHAFGRLLLLVVDEMRAAITYRQRQHIQQDYYYLQQHHLSSRNEQASSALHK